MEVNVPGIPSVLESREAGVERARYGCSRPKRAMLRIWRAKSKNLSIEQPPKQRPEMPETLYIVDKGAPEREFTKPKPILARRPRENRERIRERQK